MANTPNEDAPDYTPRSQEGSFEIHLDRESVDAYKQIHAAAQMAHMGSEIERTRSVSIHNHADLLDHLQSDNGHMMGKFAQYRNSHEETHIPGVRPIDNNFDHELSHKDLISLHHHDHGKYTDDPHTTLDGEHFHH